MTYHAGHNMVDPYDLFQRTQLHAGMHVADLGCGRTGHILFPASRIIGDAGVLYAVDIMKDVLETIRKRAGMDGIHNLHTVWTDLEHVGHTAIPPNSLDVAFLINTLVHIDNRHAVLDEARRLLKPKARLVIVDWSRKGIPFGPADDRYIDVRDILSWSTMHGFAVQEEFDMGPYHHGLILYRHN